MTDYTHVLDLGDPGSPTANKRSVSRPGGSTRATRLSLRERLASVGGLTGSLSLFVPGSGQLVLGETSRGLFFLSAIGFFVSLTWAILDTADRLAGTLTVLGYPAVAVLWALGAAFALGGAVHLWSVVGAAPGLPGSRAYHPAVSAIASGFVPGWGQVLNGHRGRATCFLAGTWITAAVWIATSAPALAMLDRLMPSVPIWEQSLRQPAVLWAARWTFPVLVWTLSVYDAWFSAAARRLDSA